MAALDLPINDVHLSQLHQIRNARKRESAAIAARASQSPPSLFTSSQTLSSLDEMAATTSTAVASNATAQGTFSSSEMKASDTAILSQYPTSLVRLLVLLAPLISIATRFVQLATWTSGPGTASHSFLLLLGWWAVCLYGYETIRYAPQAILLSIILYNGLARAFRGVSKKSSFNSSRTVTSDNLNITIDNLTVLADFYSTLSSTLYEPIVSIFTWKSFEETKAVTIFLITTWPIWLLCFGGQLWDLLGLPRVAIQFRRHTIQLITIVSPTIQQQAQRGLAWGRIHFPAVMHRATQVQGFLQWVTHFAEAHVLPIFSRIASLLPGSSSSPTLRLTLLPPFPLFSLSVRHLFLVLGTLALTWCSPWCALIRHALWRSALVRTSTRKAIALFSGRPRSSVYMYSPNASPDQTSSSQLFEKDPFSDQVFSDTATSSGAANQVSKDLTRHEDVVYQFTVFENQRWWMGLDWTAALLPQERPSWADESNNPVSPPSSFSLPPAKTTLKPAPTSSNPKAYVKRLVRWQWIDPEWTVAGRESSGELNGIQKKNRRASSTSSTRTSGTLFSNSTVGGGGGSPAVDAISSVGGGDNSRRMSNGSIGELPSDLLWLDVDAEGWQYGDNSWEKMSRKGGLGRYTRRRRWIRRAVLVEVVQKNYTPTEQELKAERGSGDEEEDEGDATSGDLKQKLEVTTSSVPVPTSPTSPSSPRSGGGDLKQRLARAAQGSSSEEK